MHIYLYDAQSNALGSLLPDLAEAALTPIPVTDDFFDRQLDLLTPDGFADRPVVMLGHPRAVKHIARLRRAGCCNPVIVLRAQRDPAAAMETLDAGADDDIVGPLTGFELRARVNAITRRFHGHAAASIHIGDVTAFFDGRDPEVAGHPMKLSQRELAIFQQIALAAPRVVSKSRIYDAVYGMADDQPFDKVIDVYIHRIRRKIEEMSPLGDPHIRTLRGRGYKLDPLDGSETAAKLQPRTSAHEIQKAQLG